MSTSPRSRAAVGCLATLALAACSGGGGQAAEPASPLVIGASLSVTGPLGSIGGPQKEGYERLVQDINAQGGVQVDGAKRMLKLVVLDNRSDAGAASQQANELILNNSAALLVGGCTPPINTPIAQTAEKNRVPLVTSCFPLAAFRGAAPQGGWTYSWDFHFEETQQAEVLLKAADRANTNKNVAIFTDNEADGVIQRQLFKSAADKAGYHVVGDYSFPVGQSDFSSSVAEAKAKGADIVLGQMIPPDGIALFKQIKSLSYVPKVVSIAKAADTAAWLEGLGTLGDGTVHNGFWLPKQNDPPTQAFIKAMDGKFKDTASLGIAAAAYSVGQVAAKALSDAGSTQPEKVNEAVGKVSGTFVFGDIKFGGDHTAVTPVVAEQWQGTDSKQVFPEAAGVQLIAPPVGLK